jgi:RNA polymerase sigma factor (sigma-70 family)
MKALSNKPHNHSVPPSGEISFLNALRECNPQAYAELYRQCRPVVIRFVQLNNGRQEDAVDLLQEAVIVLFRNLQKPDFTLRCKVSTYIYSVCRQLWLYQLRRHKPLVDSMDYVEIIPDETQADAPVTEDLVNRAIDRMDDKSRELITDYYYKNLSLAEITKNQNLPNVNCAKVRKFRCLQRLKVLVKDLLRHESPEYFPAGKPAVTARPGRKPLTPRAGTPTHPPDGCVGFSLRLTGSTRHLSGGARLGRGFIVDAARALLPEELHHLPQFFAPQFVGQPAALRKPLLCTSSTRHVFSACRTSTAPIMPRNRGASNIQAGPLDAAVADRQVYSVGGGQEEHVQVEEKRAPPAAAPRCRAPAASC